MIIKVTLLVLALASIGVFSAHAYEIFRTRQTAPFVFTADPATAKPTKRACHLKVA